MGECIMANKFLKDENGNIYVDSSGKPLQVDIPEGGGSSGGGDSPELATITFTNNTGEASLYFSNINGCIDYTVNDHESTTFQARTGSILMILNSSSDTFADWDMELVGIMTLYNEDMDSYISLIELPSGITEGEVVCG